MDINKFRPGNSTYLPKDYGFKSYSSDVGLPASSYTPTIGRIIVTRLKIDKSTSLSNIHLMITGVSGMDITGAYGCIFQNNILLGQTDNKVGSVVIGGVTFVLIVPVVVNKGYIDVGVWFSGGATPPNIARGGGLISNSAFLTGTDIRFSLADTGLTTMAPAILGTKSALNAAVWMAVS
jgi:hypothetical protein